MKKVIAFSLWGNNPKYCVGAEKNAALAQVVYPDWLCRFYVGKSVKPDVIDSLIKYDNTEVFVMNDYGDWRGMFWRFMAADDGCVDVMISRDADSRLSKREKTAVDAWLQSDKDFHIMRDHPYHASKIMGGMWGARNNILQGLGKEISDYEKGDFWQVDQQFLNSVVYPRIKDDACVHDPFFEKQPFPSKRNTLEFVGQIFDSNDETNMDHLKLVENETQ
jgi:protein O-GlcNAc transferase